jgi:hypothetical protein
VSDTPAARRPPPERRARDVDEWDRLGEVCRRRALAVAGLGLAGLGCAAAALLLEWRGQANSFWARGPAWQLAIDAAAGAANALLLADAARRFL